VNFHSGFDNFPFTKNANLNNTRVFQEFAQAKFPCGVLCGLFLGSNQFLLLPQKRHFIQKWSKLTRK